VVLIVVTPKVSLNVHTVQVNLRRGERNYRKEAAVMGSGSGLVETLAGDG